MHNTIDQFREKINQFLCDRINLVCTEFYYIELDAIIASNSIDLVSNSNQLIL